MVWGYSPLANRDRNQNAISIASKAAFYAFQVFFTLELIFSFSTRCSHAGHYNWANDRRPARTKANLSGTELHKDDPLNQP